MQALRQQVVTAEGLDPKAKHLIGVAVAYVQQCPDCVRVHARGARREGATESEVLEAIQVGTEVGARRALAHSRASRSATWPLDRADDPSVELDHYE